MINNIFIFYFVVIIILKILRCNISSVNIITGKHSRFLLFPNALTGFLFLCVADVLLTALRLKIKMHFNAKL